MNIANYVEILLETSPQVALDIARVQELALDYYDCLGIEEYSMNENEVDHLLGERSFSGGDIPDSVVDEIEAWQNEHPTHCKFFFKEEDSAELFLKMVERTFPHLHPVMQLKKGEDWSQKWKESYKPLAISHRVCVIPSWEKENVLARSIPYPVFIYPGQGFGTGGHETTWMCMEFIDSLYERHLLPDGPVLDFGCGSGILGILAYKLGAKRVYLYDIDAEALENSYQNLRENFYEHSYHAFTCFLPDQREETCEKGHSLILANILAPVLKDEASFLCAHLLPGGYLVLSGLLREQVEELLPYYEAHSMELVAHKIKGDWAALLWRKRL